GPRLTAPGSREPSLRPRWGLVSSLRASILPSPYGVGWPLRPAAAGLRAPLAGSAFALVGLRPPAVAGRRDFRLGESAGGARPHRDFRARENPPWSWSWSWSWCRSSFSRFSRINRGFWIWG